MLSLRSKAIVTPTLLYSSETWRLKKAYKRKFDNFDARCNVPQTNHEGVLLAVYNRNEDIRNEAKHIPPLTKIMHTRLT